VETDFHNVYYDQGLRVMGMHVGKEVYNAVFSAESTGVSFPTLVDIDGASLFDYGRYGEGVVLFPLAYLIDRSANIRAVYTNEEPDYQGEFTTLLETLLAE